MATNAPSASNTTAKNVASMKVDHVSEDVARMRPWWELTGALMGGTEAMRAAGQRFLVKWPSESDEHFAARLKAAVLFPAFERTVKTLAAKPFSKPITFSDKRAKEMDEWCANIDRQGSSLASFGKALLMEMLSRGLTGFLVDMPVRPEGAGTSRADDRRHGIRPFMTHVLASSILGWRASVGGEGDWTLTQLRLRECVQVDDGPFGTREVEQIRVLTIGNNDVYRRAEGNSEVWVQVPELSGPVKGINRIPFFPLYGEKLGFMIGRPPLLQLAHLNIKHWNSQSDQDTILHVARVPLLVATGVDDAKFEVVVSSSRAVKLPDPRSDLKYVEHSGAAIEAGKVSLDDLKDEMRQAGAELLLMKPTVATATEVVADNELSACTLQELSAELQSALNAGLACMAEWAKLGDGPGEAKLFTDFGALTLAEASLSVLVGMANSGKLSDESLYHEAQRRGVIDAARSWEDEQDRIALQGPSAGADPEDDVPPAKAGRPGPSAKE